MGAMEVERVEDSQEGVAFSDLDPPPSNGFFTISPPQPAVLDHRWSPKINMAPAVVAPPSPRINFSKLG